MMLVLRGLKIEYIEQNKAMLFCSIQKSELNKLLLY